MAITGKIKSPCIGVCSTGIGDSVCRGCKRFTHEIIYWNAYTESQRAVIDKRLNRLLAQVVAGKIYILDQDTLQRQMDYQNIPYASHADPYCWVFDLLKAGASQIESLEEFGCTLLAEWRDESLTAIKQVIDTDFYTLSSAHYERYFLENLASD